MPGGPTGRGLAWVLLAGALAAGTLATRWTLDSHLIDWEPAQWPQQAWRAWTAAFVHLSPRHFGMNLAALGLVAALGRVGALPPRTAGAWLASWPLTHIALLCMPELRHYGGLSGVLHGAVAAAAVHVACAGEARQRAVGVLTLAGLAAKVLSETPWRAAVQTSPHWDIPVAPIAHLTGAVAGALCSAVAEAAATWRPRRTQARMRATRADVE